MDLPRVALRLGTLASVALLGGLVLLAADHAGTAAGSPVVDATGTAVPVPDAPTVRLATWDHQPVLLFVVPAAELAGVDAVRGPGSATPSVEVPGHPDLRLFVLSARSTHLGCTVGFNTQLPSTRDVANYAGGSTPGGRILDPCHFGQWDAFARGKPFPGTPAPARLASLELRLEDGRILGIGFDGPVGIQQHG